MQDPYLSANLKSKYFPSSTFWRSPTNTPKSVFWSSILTIRPTLLNNCTYQIAVGNTSIWTQPWCPIWTSMNELLIYPNPQPSIPNIVSDLWLPGTKDWDSNKIMQVFGAEAMQTITNMQVLNTDDRDILCWIPSTSGQYTTKEAYKHLAIQAHPSSPTRHYQQLSGHTVSLHT